MTELVAEFLQEGQETLAAVRADLAQPDAGGRIARRLQSLSDAAGFLGFSRVQSTIATGLAHPQDIESCLGTLEDLFGSIERDGTETLSTPATPPPAAEGDLLQDFLLEAEEHLAAAETCLARLQTAPD
ncbi:MAG TPA: hypothetical protein VGO93_06540, partial [Candidatus Xenobia bacterium]